MKDDPLNRLKVKRGMDLPWSKMTDDDIREIRSLVETRERVKHDLKRMTNAAIAKRYGVHVRTIDRITQGETWGHVE